MRFAFQIGLACVLLISGLSLTAGLSHPVGAQPLTVSDAVWHSPTSVPHFERYGAPLDADVGLWRATKNPAGLASAVLPDQGWAGLSFADIDGPLHRPQHPSGLQLGQLQSEGTATLSGWQVYGAFAYTRRNDRRVEWSAISDPHDRRAYVWADSIGGAWYRNHVDLEAAFASPKLLDRVYGGVRIQYSVGQGARRNDPRPQYRTRTVDVQPGVSVGLGAQHEVGAQAVLRWQMEENEYGLFTTDDPFVYRLRGYGTFDRAQIVRGERRTSGPRYGGSVQYAGAASAWQWDAGITYTTGEDEVQDGIRAPAFGGRHNVQEFQFSGAAQRSRSALSVQLRADAGWWEGRGTDPVFRAVNVISEDAHLQLEASLWPGERRAQASWGIGAAIRGDEVLRRDVVSQTEWAATALQTTVRGWIQHQITSSFVARVQPQVGYYQPVAHRYAAQSPTRLTSEIVYPDYAYYSTARWATRMHMGIGWRSSGADSDRLRLSVTGDYSRAQAPIEASRRALRITLHVLGR